MAIELTQSKRLFIGEVVSDKMDKTRIVKVVTTYTHPRFHKILRKMKKYAIHDERNESKVGDVVEFCSSRPVSKTKRMHLTRIVTISRAGQKVG